MHKKRSLCFTYLSTLAALFAVGLALPGVDSQSRQDLAEFTGRYSDGENYAVYFEATKYGLTIRPVLWTATQLLRPTGKSSFEVVDRTSRGAEFFRDASGKVRGVKIRGMEGEGLELTKYERPLLPVELLLSGNTNEAADLFRSRGKPGLHEALETAENVYRRLPTKRRYVVALLTAMRPDFAQNAKFFALFGNAQVAANDRANARQNFKRSYTLDQTNEDSISGLARLNALPTDYHSSKPPWPLPFSLSDVFARPTAAEINAVRADWATRDLRPDGIREEARGELNIDGWTANVRIYSYLVHGFRNYGAVIVPKNASPGCCPVIIDAKGVSPTYFPLDLDRIESVRMMDDLKDRFIYVVPSFRGEILNFAGRTYTSEGDRRDALDGATDDTLAFLNVALQMTPEADAKRMCAFGHSRGGTVAMLAGIRDKRIKCVVNVAGPVDWFYAMGTDGWTEQELWQEGVRIHATPLEAGGQDLERFMGRAIEGKADLAAVRHNMIASSPLYFARLLPPGKHYYGIEDVSVPVMNAEQLRAALPPANRSAVVMYPGQGHDTDRIEEPRSAKTYIVKALGVK
jgi:hypothetical protein